MPSSGFCFRAPSDAGRLDRLVADATGYGRRSVRQWFRLGQVRVNGHIASAADIPPAGSEIFIHENQDGRETLSTASPQLRIVMQAEHHLVLAKPAGLHCERGKSAGSVAEILEEWHGDLSGIGERAEEAGLVHRLDRDTSGVLLAARDRAEYDRLRNAFHRGDATKQYLALAAGHLVSTVTVDLSLARRAGRMTVAGPGDDALPALTTLEPLHPGDGWTLVLATMRTGVTHQVRVHAAAAGHPLLGDSLYGGPCLEGCRRSGQLLHALRVRVGGDIDATVGPPEDFLEAYASLRRRGG